MYLCLFSDATSLSSTSAPLSSTSTSSTSPSTSIFSSLVFPSLSLGSEEVQTLSLINDAPLSVEYEWVWIENNTVNNRPLSLREIERKGKREVEKRRERRLQLLLDREETTDRDRDRDRETQRETNRETPDLSLLRSLKREMNSSIDDNDEDNRERDTENVSCLGPFEICPTRGVISGEGLQSFQVRCHPRGSVGSGLGGAQEVLLVLMLKSVPQVAVPSIHQHQLQRQLEVRGHGEYYRLESWLYDLSVSAAVSDRDGNVNKTNKSKEGQRQRNTAAGMFELSLC